MTPTACRRPPRPPTSRTSSTPSSDVLSLKGDSNLGGVVQGVPLKMIQRQLGHASLGTTSIYLHGIDPEGSSRPFACDARR
jgi:integrase